MRKTSYFANKNSYKLERGLIQLEVDLTSLAGMYNVNLKE